MPPQMYARFLTCRAVCCSMVGYSPPSDPVTVVIVVTLPATRAEPRRWGRVG